MYENLLYKKTLINIYIFIYLSLIIKFLLIKMVRRIEGTIDYEKHTEILNDNHKVLVYLDDMTLTGKLN
jgi:hypothetical protein